MKKVLITGVNSGIGYAACLVFAKEGYEIFGIDLNEGFNLSLDLKIKTLGSKLHYSQCDVSNKQQVETYFDTLKTNNILLNVLVNNAGILGPRTKTTDYPTEAFDSVLNVNIKGVFYLMQNAIPNLIESENSSIVNVASVAGLVGMTNHIAYSASKHAVVGMTKTVALEYAKNGLRVNAVCPGFTETSMLEDSNLEGEVLAGLKYATPMRRFGKAEEIASAIYYLASNNASFITGQCLTLDGGLTAQ